MADFFELQEKYKRKETPELDAFLTALQRQIEAFNEANFSKRSWVKETPKGYSVKLGKLDGSYDIPTKEEVSEFLHSALTTAQTDANFQTTITAAYSKAEAEEPVGQPAVKGRRGRPKKNA